MRDVIEALSWRIAAELASSVPGARILHLHPGGGQYDVLQVAWQGGEIMVNRSGTIQAWHMPGPGLQLDWVTDVLAHGTRGTVRHILTRTGQQPRRGPTDARRRGYRVVASALEHALRIRQEGWTCVAAMFDSSGDWSGVMRETLLGIPELEAADPYEVWSIQRRRQPVASVLGARAWFPDGQSMDLMSAPSSEEERLGREVLLRAMDFYKEREG